MFKAVSLVVLAVSITGVGRVSADVSLATIVLESTGQTTAQPSWKPFISYGNPNMVDPAGYMNGITLTLLDVVNGTSHELTGDFAGFESSATDGVNQPLYLGITVPGGTGETEMTTEQALLASAFGTAPGVGTPDFSGYDLTRVRIMGTAFQSGAGGAFTVTTEFQIYGNRVPEPASALALLLAVPRRRR